MKDAVVSMAGESDWKLQEALDAHVANKERLPPHARDAVARELHARGLHRAEPGGLAAVMLMRNLP